MDNGLRCVAVFDFDGTLTTKDTFVQFIVHVFGVWRMIMGFALFSPILGLMKLHLFPNGKAKQILFSWFFRGMSYKDFTDYGKSFAKKIMTFQRYEVHSELRNFLESKTSVYIVTASIEEWVRPYCENLGVTNVLATKVGVDSNGLLTGKFASNNCYGKEKVVRLLEAEPIRESYYLTVFGDSKGDREMLNFADKSIMI